MSELSKKALEMAISQIGKEENPRGSNWGKSGDPVPMYLKRVGLTFPASWCMAFMYWCFDEAALSLGVPNPMAKTAGVLDQWAKRTGARVKLPQPDNLFIMDHEHGLRHTKIIEAINANGWMVTIEGNTNSDGSRNGYAVERRSRQNTIPIIGYLRF